MMEFIMEILLYIAGAVIAYMAVWFFRDGQVITGSFYLVLAAAAVYVGIRTHRRRKRGGAGKSQNPGQKK